MYQWPVEKKDATIGAVGMVCKSIYADVKVGGETYSWLGNTGAEVSVIKRGTIKTPNYQIQYAYATSRANQKEEVTQPQ